MAGSNITKPLYESLCSFRGKLTCFTEFVNLLPDDAVTYQGDISVTALVKLLHHVALNKILAVSSARNGMEPPAEGTVNAIG